MDGQQDPQQYAPQGGYPTGPYPPRQPLQGAPKKKGAVRRWAFIIGVFVVALILAGIIDNALQHKATGGGGTCTTSSCIVSDLNSSLVGLTAKDDLVSTKAVCVPSSERDDGNGIYAATCTVTYSDGSTATGTGTLDLTQNQVSFAPALP